MKITDVEAIVIRQASLDGAIADGSQDDLVVRVRTDEGIDGIGEVDSSPEVARAVIYAPDLARAHGRAARPPDRGGPARHRAPVAEDVPRCHLPRTPRGRDPRAQRHRHRAVGHQGQGARQARLAS